MKQISFFEQYEWNEERRAMKFWAKLDAETLTCWIHESALVAPDNDADEQPSNQEYFMDHMERIHTIARQLIVNSAFDKNHEVYIDAAVLERLGV